MALKFDAEAFYTLVELAEMTGHSRETLRMYLKKGTLRGRKFAGTWYISGKTLIDFFGDTEERDRNEGKEE